jgi:hypothetical protein
MGKSKVETLTVPDPSLLNPRDAIIKVTRTAICGSDLHLFDGFIPTMESGDILGHEFMGIVEEVETELSCPSPLRAAIVSSARRRFGRPVTIQTQMLTLWRRLTAIQDRDCSATRT